MKKLVLTGLKGCLCLSGLILIATLLPTQAEGQGCIMACPPNEPPVPVSVSQACEDTITYEDLDVFLSGCPGEILVNIIDGQDTIGNIVTSEMVGNTYMVIISHPLSGQSCMTMMIVLDKQAPTVNCPADITLECTADLDLYIGLDSSDVFDCSATNIFYNDVLISSPGCDSNIISQYRRTYIIVDAYNNGDSCEQIISLEKASLDDVVFPPNLTGINALACFPAPNADPAITGFPEVNGNPIVNGSFCNLSTLMIDDTVSLCSGSYKIFRTWTVFDWCAGNISIDSIQIIEIADNTPPLVQAPPNMTVSASSTECEADVLIPPALIFEDCSATWSVRTQGPFGTIQSNGGLMIGLPVGVHSIIFIATNACNLEGRDTMLLSVQDLQPPIPVCQQTLSIPLNHAGIALIPAIVFNAASLDNCGDVFFKVRRMNTPAGYVCANPGNPNNLFDDHIQFCCEDIINNEIMVILRVYDVLPVAGPVSNDYLQGHYNECMVSVEVQDKLPPVISCPTDLTISCEFPFTAENLDVFGKVALSPDDQEQICIDDPGVPGNPGVQCIGLDGLASDNCGVIVESTAIIDVDMCGTGSIVRTFTATDDGGIESTCEQVITIINYDLFNVDDITWPADYITTNICEIALLDPEDLPPPYNEPVLDEGVCDLAGSTYTDAVYDFSNTDQACFKILRTWTVLDWCQVNTPSGGQWTHIQVIKVMNNVGPVIEPIEDITQCSFDPLCGGLTLDFEASATDDCSGPLSITWRYSIDEDNDGTFDFVSTPITGSSILFSRTLPIGAHRIVYTVWDQCGNITFEEQLVTIESCKPPSAKCIHGLSTNLMAMDLDGDGTPYWGMVTLQASMFDAGSDHPCGNAITVAFSADPLDVTRVFDCSDLGENEVELWAIDENGLTDFCITTVDIQDNNSICPPGLGGSGTISGNISVPGSGKLSGAMIYLDQSNQPGIASGANGYFVFPSIPFGNQYVVRPTRNEDAGNGVSTIDLVRMQKHLLGLESFSNPFQYIAADVNNSKSITAIDIIQLRKLILGYYTELPNNTSWRFIDAAHVFPDPANPWQSTIPESYMIHSFSASMNEVNFDAVKIGDLNHSASVNVSGKVILPRTTLQGELSYTIESPQENDNILRVDMYLHDAIRYNALQFSFNWNQNRYELIDWAPGELLSTDNIRMPGTGIEPGSLSTYTLEEWNQDKLHLVTMWIRPRQSDPGNFKLFLTQGPTEGVVYALQNEEPFSLVLLDQERKSSQISNKPNPFKDKTNIVYQSDLDDTGMLKFFDLNGRIVHTRDVAIWKGINEYIIHKSELPKAGIYLYEIVSAYQHSTNRMIIVE